MGSSAYFNCAAERFQERVQQVVQIVVLKPLNAEGQPSCLACKTYFCGTLRNSTVYIVVDGVCTYCPVNNFAYTNSGGCAAIQGITNFAPSLYLPHSQPLGVLTIMVTLLQKQPFRAGKESGHNNPRPTLAASGLQWGHATL